MAPVQVAGATVNPSQRGPVWTPITPQWSAPLRVDRLGDLD